MSNKRLTKRGKITIGIFTLTVILSFIYIQFQAVKPSQKEDSKKSVYKSRSDFKKPKNNRRKRKRRIRIR